MAGNKNPATMGGAWVVAKAAKLATLMIHENGSHRERDLDYRGVIALLGDGWRVIECADRLQWVLQRRKGVGSGRRADWRGVGYFLTRDALIAASAAYDAPCAVGALARLANLPPFHPGRARHA